MKSSAKLRLISSALLVIPISLFVIGFSLAMLLSHLFFGVREYTGEAWTEQLTGFQQLILALSMYGSAFCAELSMFLIVIGIFVLLFLVRWGWRLIQIGHVGLLAAWVGAVSYTVMALRWYQQIRGNLPEGASQALQAVTLVFLFWLGIMGAGWFGCSQIGKLIAQHSDSKTCDNSANPKTTNLKWRYFRFFAVAAVLLVALLILNCGAPGRIIKITNDKSGKLTATVYSDIYEVRKILIPNTLGIQILVQDKKRCGLGCKVKQIFSILGPDDLHSPADSLLLFFNLRAESLPVSVTSIRLQKEEILKQPIQWKLSATETKRLTISDLKIFSNATELDCELVLAVDGLPASYPLRLRRLTEDESNRLFDKPKKDSKVGFFDKSF